MAWRQNYYFGIIKANVKPDDIRKQVLLRNFVESTKQIVDRFLDLPENCERDTFHFYWRNLNNPNFTAFYPDTSYSDTVILLWDCCNNHEVLFSEDLITYKNKDMCSNCKQILEDMFKDIQITPNVPDACQATTSSVPDDSQTTPLIVLDDSQTTIPSVPGASESTIPCVPDDSQTTSLIVPDNSQTAALIVPGDSQTTIPSVPCASQTTSLVPDASQTTISSVPDATQPTIQFVPDDSQTTSAIVPDVSQTTVLSVSGASLTTIPCVPDESRTTPLIVPDVNQIAPSVSDDSHIASSPKKRKISKL